MVVKIFTIEVGKFHFDVDSSFYADVNASNKK